MHEKYLKKFSRENKLAYEGHQEGRLVKFCKFTNSLITWAVILLFSVFLRIFL